MATRAPSSASTAEVAGLVATLDEAPDKLHSDFTPSVYRLIEIGRPALESVLELMLSGQELTRLRAQRVHEGVVMKLFGFVPGQGWPEPAAEDRFRALWRRLGDLDWRAGREARETAVERWQEWLAGRQDRGDRR